MKKIIISILLIIVGVLGGTQIVNLGGAPAGANADVSTSSVVAISAVARQIFASSTNCISRIITGSGEADIFFEFDDEIPVADSGTSHVQASTTKSAVIYDGGLVGCGSWRAISTSNTSARIIEFTSFR